MQERVQVFAVIRIDDFKPMPEAVTVKEILPTLDEAQTEVRRLNTLNRQKGARYFAHATRYFPQGRGGCKEEG